MNQIHIPIREVHLETVFEKGRQTQYALLEPEGGVSPLRVRFDDLRERLADRFHADLSNEEVVARLHARDDQELVVQVSMDQERSTHWEIRVRERRFHVPAETDPVMLSEARASRRLRPGHPADIKLELGQSSIEGTVYNISEHGLGIALLTTQLESLPDFAINEEVGVVADGQQSVGRIRSQYPADGGCVLGIELKDRFDPSKLCEA